jgi:NSS family neurotransmitter:Na+ symporter
MYLSANTYAPDTWFNPLSPYSVATVVLQWAVALGLVWFFRKPLMGKSH